MRTSQTLRRFIAAAAIVVAVAGLPTAPSSAAIVAGQRVDLKLLVVADTGTEPTTQAWTTTLRNEGVPFDLVTLATQPLPALSDGANHAYYQGVVLANAWQPNLSAEGRTALNDVESRFGLREVVAYAYPTPELGLNYPSSSGNLKGVAARLTPAGRAVFTQLAGPVPVIDDVWGYLSTPLDPSWQTFVETTAGNPLVGSFTRADGVEQLVQTFDSNAYMTHQRVLAHGLLTWLTRGVHLGYQRNNLAVHIDDVLLPNDRWSTVGKCTPNSDCPTNPDGTSQFATAPIRMTPADVTRAVKWRQRTGVRLDMVFNGQGSLDAIADNGSDPLTTALVDRRHQFGWINHTFTHDYMGCVQDFSVVPWRCATNATGATQWVPKDKIVRDIKDNIALAEHLKLPFNKKELVTGQHSGLRSNPQQPVDNPNLAPALNDQKISVIASDASREPTPRMVGKAAVTLPRHPNNTYYNVGTYQEHLDEYNWLYVAQGSGGSCVNSATTTCSTTPFNYFQMVARDSAIMLGHVLSNDPRPTYMHQSNLAENGTAYPMLNAVVGTYRAWFTAPLVSPTMTEASTLLAQSSAWNAALAAGHVTAYVQDGVVHVMTASTAPKLFVPVTAPAGLTRLGTTTLFGTLYGGEQSGWTRLDPGQVLRLDLP